MARTIELIRSKRAVLLSVAFSFIFVSSSSFAQLNRDVIVGRLSAEINRAIDKNPKKLELREKVIRRIAECAFIYGVMSKNMPEADIKKHFRDAADINLDILALISSGISMDRYKEILDVAGQTIADMAKRNDKKETFNLLRSCKAFSEPNELADAMYELTL